MRTAKLLTVMTALVMTALVMTIPVMGTGAQAGEMLRVTVDKAELIPLPAQPNVVVVADPAIADVIVEQNRLLFVVGKRAGETRLFVYGGGKQILMRDIVVAPNDERAVTVIRDTTATTYSCAPRCAPTSGSAPAQRAAPAAP